MGSNPTPVTSLPPALSACGWRPIDYAFAGGRELTTHGDSAMLVLKRRVGETVVADDGKIVFRILDIDRGEVHEAKVRDGRAAKSPHQRA